MILIKILSDILIELKKLNATLQKDKTKLLKSREVAALCGFEYNHFNAKIKTQPDFPKPIIQSSQPRWKESDIIDWLETKKETNHD